MPVRKFRSLLEVEPAKRILPGSVEFSRALRSVFWLAATFAPVQKAPPGVHKFRCLEEAQARKKAWARGRDE
jgi:hypothetical protein